MRIFAFHLLNDYSGSPKVLMQLLKAWVANGIDVHIVTGSGRKGFLSEIDQATYIPVMYRWSSVRLIRLINLFFSQVALVFQLFFVVKRTDIIYINTVLPFGAALLGKLKGCRVIYHIHETSIRPVYFKKFLFGFVKWAADDVIYVSEYLARKERLPNCRTHILYNAIEDDFLEKAALNRTFSDEPENVLMVCSLKAYKGVFEFVELAHRLRHYSFRLVLNADRKSIDQFFKRAEIPDNLQLYSTQTDLHSFYAWADMLLNLSRPDGWVETFGLTVIEGMAYGLPVIVPPVGGITEIVERSKNGYLIDCRNVSDVASTLHFIMDNKMGYRKMHNHALEMIENYREDVLIKNNLDILLNTNNRALEFGNLIPEYGIVPQEKKYN